jgi:hypothetical protein
MSVIRNFRPSYIVVSLDKKTLRTDSSSSNSLLWCFGYSYTVGADTNIHAYMHTCIYTPLT